MSPWSGFLLVIPQNSIIFWLRFLFTTFCSTFLGKLFSVLDPGICELPRTNSQLCFLQKFCPWTNNRWNFQLPWNFHCIWVQIQNFNFIQLRTGQKSIEKNWILQSKNFFVSFYNYVWQHNLNVWFDWKSDVEKHARSSFLDVLLLFFWFLKFAPCKAE